MAASAEQLSSASKSAQQRQQASKQQEALRPLTGLRACANIGIMILHILWLRTHLPGGPGNVPLPLKLRLMGALFVLQTSMDVLFLLCGFHAALALVPALTKPGTSPRKVVLQYWWRRAVRIVPAYYVALAASWYLLMHPAVRQEPESVPEAASAVHPFDPASCPSALWLDAAFVNNWGPIPGCGAPFWSQAVMGQFWLLAPVALAALRPRQPGFRRRIALGAGVIIASSTVFRAVVILRHGMRMPLPAFPSTDPLDEATPFAAYLRWLHMSLAARLGSLAVGVLLALPFTQQEQPRKSVANVGTDSPGGWRVGRWKIAAAAVTCVAAAAVRLGFFEVDSATYADEAPWPLWVSLPFMALMLQGGVGIAAALAALTYACMARTDPLGRVGHGVLSTPLWRPLSDLSYSAYLYHIQVRVWVWRYRLLPSGLANSAADMRALGIEIGVVLPATYAVAWLSRLLIERPAAQLLRKVAAASLPAKGGKSYVTGKADESIHSRSVLKAD